MSEREADDRDARRRRALRAVLEAIEPGWDVDPAALLARHPDLAHKLDLLVDDTLPEPDPSGGPEPAPVVEVASTVHELDPIAQEPDATRVGREAGDTVEAGAATMAGAGDTLAFVVDRTHVPTTTGSEAESAAEVPRVGTRIRYFGDYELMEELGRGGMGVVYRARQVSLNRPVAVKMLLSGPYASETELRRFHNEAEAIALLDHEGIIPIYEVGERAGRHYFSMKLIEGKSLARHLNRFRDRPRAAAELLVRIADAVQHANSRGILHRDLKPGNILLDADGRPHVGDFGLAWRLDGSNEMTASNAIVGTMGYFSPEQAIGRRGGLTIATDVYGLGAVLYALLTGHAPFRASSYQEAVQLVREERPEPPSRTNPRVDRDLETICLKCLEKESSRRYESAAALAADLRRWLAGEPIEARPVGPLTRSWLWARRKPAAATLLGALAASVLIGVVGIGWNWLEVRARRAELALANRDLTRQRDVLNVLNHFLLDDLIAQAGPDRNPRREAITVETALDRAAAAAGERFAGYPALEAAVRLQIGQTYLQLGRPARAVPQLETSLDLARRLYAPDAPEVVDAALALATARREVGRLDQAEPLARATAAVLRLRLGDDHPGVLRADALLASILRDQNRLDEAEGLYRRTVDTQARVLGESHLATNATRNDLAALLDDRGRLDEAENLLRRVVDHRRASLRPDHPSILIAQANLAALQHRRGAVNEADILLTELLPACRAALGDDHDGTLMVLANLGAVDLKLGRLDAAEAHLGEALAGQAATLGDEHPTTLNTSSSLAMVPVARGQPAQATPRLREVYRIRLQRQGAAHVDTVRTAINLAMSLQAIGQPTEAVVLFDRYLPSFRSLTPEGEQDVDRILLSYGAALLSTGDASRAVMPLEEAVATRHRTLPAGSWRIAAAESFLGDALVGEGRRAEGERFLVGAATAIESAEEVPRRSIESIFNRVVTYYAKLGRPEAATWSDRRTKAIDRLNATPPAPH